ncbi:MAG: hypothetical protein KA198_03210 [Chitinophagaceae bacterium]|nr:hypothetical protein [Chitinophagaceae bacterium]
MEKLLYPRFLLVKDNFYKNPQIVLEAVKQASFYEPEHVTGFRSRTVYHEPGVKQKLEKILGVKITRWDTDPIEENGVFYQGFSDGKRKEVPGVHSDEPYNDITVLIYLTPDLPYDCGTSLWMHKQTGLINPATPQDARRLNIKLSELRNRLEEDSKLRDKWVEIDRVGNRFNRMVAYPSGALHSATKHFGGDMKNGRIYQTFRIGVDWSTFKMNNV